ncbi:MAG: hypothetical protein JW820_05715 [Spirochaetales bacterium]|nr:hypothetical protein [Spirochaetales bacterium]
MKKLVSVLLAAAAVLTLVLGGCATAPQPVEAAPVQPPDWVLNPPESDSGYTYFTGSGSSAAGSLGEAEEIARIEVLSEIMRYLGVRITSETTATAKASLDSFQADVVQQLKQSSSGRVSGLEISERWVQERGEAVTMYLLARYNKVDLEREKRRLEEIFQEKIEAVAGPEAEGDALAAQGAYYQAALRYLEAAAASFKSDLENADIKFERNLNKAKEAVRQIGLVKLNDNLQGFAGSELPEPFLLKVVSGSTADDPGIGGAAIRVVYKEIRSSGREAVRTRQLKSAEDGMVSFAHPVLQFVGKGQVTMSLDLSEAIETLEGVPDRLYPQVEAVEQLVIDKKVTYEFGSTSRAVQIPTGVAVFDLDASSNPIALTETSAGLLEKLGKAGFQVVPLPVAVTGIAGRTDAQVVAFLARNFTGQVERAVFGTARISDHAQDGNYVIIQVTGTVKVAELGTGEILLTINKSKRAQGTNTSAALAAAFKKLGEDMGEDLINQLR